jgi:hypothetical protein
MGGIAVRQAPRIDSAATTALRHGPGLDVVMSISTTMRGRESNSAHAWAETAQVSASGGVDGHHYARRRIKYSSDHDHAFVPKIIVAMSCPPPRLVLYLDRFRRFGSNASR